MKSRECVKISIFVSFTLWRMHLNCFYILAKHVFGYCIKFDLITELPQKIHDLTINYEIISCKFLGFRTLVRNG